MHKVIHPHFRYTEMRELYISIAMRSFAGSLVGVFIPIYLYVEGFSLTFIAVYYFMMHVVRLFSHVMTDRLIRRFGAKHIMGASGVLDIINIIALVMVPFWSWTVWIAMVAFGLGAGQWWSARHIQVAVASEGKKGSSDVGRVQAIAIIATVLAPAIGGVIATQFGIVYSLLLGVVVVVLSLYPLFRTDEILRFIPKQSIKPFHFSFYNPVQRSMFMRGVQENISIFAWPIFIYIALTSYQLIGGVFSLSMLIGAAIAYMVGKYGDMGKNPLILRLGSFAYMLVHLLRVLGRSFMSILSIDIAGTIASVLVTGPYFAEYYKRAGKSRDIIGYVTNIEVAACLGAAVVWLLVMSLSLFFTDMNTLIMSFFVAAVASFFIKDIATKHTRFLHRL